MTGETSGEQLATTQERFNTRLAYWNNYFATADVKESMGFKSDAMNELDMYWEELGYMDKEFIVYGNGEFTFFADEYSNENLQGCTEQFFEEGSGSQFPREVRSYKGSINGRRGVSWGFDIVSPVNDQPPRLVFMFESEKYTLVIPNQVTNSTSLIMIAEVDGINLVDPEAFSIIQTVSAENDDEENADEDGLTDAELEAEADSVAASGIEITATISECSEELLKLTRSPTFRHRKASKQIEMLRHEIERYETLAPVFGQMAVVEAEHVMVNQGSALETPSFRTIDASEIILQGICGGLVLPWMHDIYQKGIRSNRDMIYIAGGLCLALLPVGEIYIPSTKELIPADRNILIPISGQKVEAHIYPVIE